MNIIIEEKKKSVIRDLAAGVRQYLVAYPTASKEEVFAAMMSVMKRESMEAGDHPILAQLIFDQAASWWNETWDEAHKPDSAN